MTWLADTATSYDTVASSYADFVSDALEKEPYLKAALKLFAAEVDGPVVDVGCGPGHFTAYLASLGVEASGVDLSPGMIDLARRSHPGLRFEVGSMTDLALPDGSVAGVLASWSLIHVPDESVPATLGHFHRVLRPGGLLMIGYHVGAGTRLKTEGYGGHPMRVNVHLRQPWWLARRVRDAGFTVDAEWLLSPGAKVPQAILFAAK
ncbi:methyltransferase [Amycolatopsis mediterranei S699]|uniref:Methyltransferase n=2 Tax=Amycolatopsis mediterranei TaxID=33910 RepID=A0A0H3DCW3_AMYMU|nr:class I SAM-dependent methyltransferase [Amycolatopsis mediterranei]ADJ48067.1 methyltransferase [Amycolatopsis mediterranei U32]AEK44968.1 methyltransferase [Amycolatopsis mediterranei S699]AFO79778.1 methyltransferase [Amycolatopsis mediterranei S699]AGT86906.1 methyltransferase [Amycolatopsis mediterranei RB]KDO10553.1 methyltransferase [Amycolatopsis mediterranei]